MRKYLRFPGFKPKALTLSYDDGQGADRKLVEIMVKYGIKGTFNLCSGIMERDKGSNRVGVEEAKDLYLKNGMEIAVHGDTHGFWAREPEIDGIIDALNDRKNHEKSFGTFIRGMAYPNGSASISDGIVRAMEQIGLIYGRTTISTLKFLMPTEWLRWNPTCHHKDAKLNELINAFLKRNPNTDYDKYPALFYLWGHSYEFNNDNNWEVIEDFCQRLSNKEDTWYATNIEICEYVKAYEQLIYDVDNTMVKNPTCIDVFVKYGDKEVVIPAGQTVKIS